MASLGLCVAAEGQLLPVSCFSPAGVMSDKRQRARVQGSWARPAPKPSGPAGRYRLVSRSVVVTGLIN